MFPNPGTLYWLLIFPVDVIKSSMMSDAVLKSERKYSSMMDCTKQLMKEGGIGRFYRYTRRDSRYIVFQTA